MEVLYFYPRKTIQTHRFILPKCWKNAKNFLPLLPFIVCYSVTSSHTFRLDNQSAASLVPLQPMRSQLDRNPMLCYAMLLKHYDGSVWRPWLDHESKDIARIMENVYHGKSKFSFDIWGTESFMIHGKAQLVKILSKLCDEHFVENDGWVLREWWLMAVSPWPSTVGVSCSTTIWRSNIAMPVRSGLAGSDEECSKPS